jgi:hypothetical protein
VATQYRTLKVDTDVYEVIEWSPTRVVAVDQTPICTHYIYVFDFATQSATGIRKRKADSPAHCSDFDRELRLTMKQGFAISWQEREQATPWFGRLALAPLKLFQ